MAGARVKATGPLVSTAPFVKSLMQRVTEPGKMAAWLAPPKGCINGPARRLRTCTPETTSSPRCCSQTVTKLN